MTGGGDGMSGKETGQRGERVSKRQTGWERIKAGFEEVQYGFDFGPARTGEKKPGGENRVKHSRSWKWRRQFQDRKRVAKRNLT